MNNHACSFQITDNIVFSRKITEESNVPANKNTPRLSGKEHKGKEAFESLKIPANWEEAQDHAKSRTTTKEQNEDCQFKKICKCCGYEIDRVPIDWIRSNPVEDFDFLGAGYPLFYNYLIMCNILLGILVLGECIPDFIRNYQGDFCNKSATAAAPIKNGNGNHGKQPAKVCLQSFFNRSSLSNILDVGDTFNGYQIYYKIAVYFLLMVTLYYSRHQQRKINNEVDIQIQSPADYSIIIKNIPKKLKVNYVKELKKMINNYKAEIQIKVEKIVLVYELEKIEEIEKEIDKKVLQKQEWLKNNLLDGMCQYESEQVEEFDEQIEKLEKENEHIIKEVIDTPEKYFAGTAIVSLSHESMKNAMIEGNQIPNWRRIQNHFWGGKSDKWEDSVLYWNDRHLYVEQAPEPNDIDWEFIHCSTNERLKARFISNIFQALIMLVCFWSIWTLSFFQSKMVDDAKEADERHEKGADQKFLLAQCVSGVISVALVLFNKFALPIIIHQIVDREKWSTKTKMNISFAIKLTLVLFCNTALMTLAVEILTFDNYYGNGGMIGTESMVFILNAFVPPLAWLINPWYIFKNLDRNKEEKLHQEQRSVLTQKQMNELHENPLYLSGKRYADIMKTMWFSFLYSPVLPLGSIFSFIGLSFYYWVDKYNIVHKFTAKENISIDLTMKMIDLLDLIIIIHAVGDLFFKRQLYGTIDHADVLFLGISALFNIIMYFDIQLFDSGARDEVMFYKEVYREFDTDYDRENPYLKKKAIENYVKERQQITYKEIADERSWFDEINCPNVFQKGLLRTKSSFWEGSWAGAESLQVVDTSRKTPQRTPRRSNHSQSLQSLQFDMPKH